METQVKEVSEKRKRFLENRKHLIELSKVIRAKMAMGLVDGVNEGLKELYEEDGHEELNTFHQWIKLGYVVKKGSRALLLWGSPKKTAQGDDDEDDSTKYWPMCYVFSNLQVEERMKR